MKKEKKTLSIIVDKETYELLQKEAEDNMCSISYIVRKALKDYFNKNKKNK